MVKARVKLMPMAIMILKEKGIKILMPMVKPKEREIMILKVIVTMIQKETVKETYLKMDLKTSKLKDSMMEIETLKLMDWH